MQSDASDRIASIIRLEQEFIGLKRITLITGESKAVTFNLNLAQLVFKNDEGNWVIEAGSFDISFGKSSDKKPYIQILTVSKTVNIDYTKRSFFTKCKIQKGGEN